MIDSLKEQVDDSYVFLFQDGPANAQDKQLTEQCIDIFEKSEFKNAHTFAAPTNLGVAFNQKRAREFVFSISESAIFIEDDIVLNSYYIKLLNMLMDFFENDTTIGMISCFGEPHRHPKVFDFFEYLQKNEDWNQQQELNKQHIIHMEHLFAYGLFRDAYAKVADKLNEYYRLLPGKYAMRPHQKICDYIRSIGLEAANNKTVTSQDSILSGLLILNNTYKISTFTMNAKYIGEVGVHSTPENYKNNWANVTPYDNFVSQYFWTPQVKQRVINMCRHTAVANPAVHDPFDPIQHKYN